MHFRQIFVVYGPNTAAPPTPPSATISAINVDVLTSDDELRFGVDESYNLTVSGASATISANTVFGALWGLETLSQLIHRVWSTGPSGAVNASYYQVCEATIQDAPRFPYRGESAKACDLLRLQMSDSQLLRIRRAQSGHLNARVSVRLLDRIDVSHWHCRPAHRHVAPLPGAHGHQASH